MVVHNLLMQDICLLIELARLIVNGMQRKCLAVQPELARRNKKFRALDAIVAASTDEKLLHKMFNGSWGKRGFLARMHCPNVRHVCCTSPLGKFFYHFIDLQPTNPILRGGWQTDVSSRIVRATNALRAFAPTVWPFRGDVAEQVDLSICGGATNSGRS